MMGGSGVIVLAQDRGKCWKLANSAMNLRFPQNVGNFSTRWGTDRFSGRTVAWRYSSKAHGCEGWVNYWNTLQTLFQTDCHVRLLTTQFFAGILQVSMYM